MSKSYSCCFYSYHLINNVVLHLSCVSPFKCAVIFLLQKVLPFFAIKFLTIRYINGVVLCFCLFITFLCESSFKNIIGGVEVLGRLGGFIIFTQLLLPTVLNQCNLGTAYPMRYVGRMKLVTQGRRCLRGRLRSIWLFRSDTINDKSFHQGDSDRIYRSVLC